MMVQKVEEGNCPLLCVVKFITVCSPGEKRVFGFSLVLHRRSPYCFSDALSGLLAFFFFLLLTSSHTALLLRSSGCHPPKRPRCNRSRFLAAMPLGPAFLRPANRSAAVRALNAGSSLRKPARPRSRRNSAPKWQRTAGHGFHSTSLQQCCRENSAHEVLEGCIVCVDPSYFSLFTFFNLQRINYTNSF